jgi:hypothetical protein
LLALRTKSVLVKITLTSTYRSIKYFCQPLQQSALLQVGYF